MVSVCGQRLSRLSIAWGTLLVIAGCGRAETHHETRQGALAANATANNGAQAKADAYAEEAALYAQLASANRAAAAVSAGTAASQSAATEMISTSTRASTVAYVTMSSQTPVAAAASLDPAAVQRTLSAIATAATSRQSDHEKAASLADRLAANALRAALFYQAKARNGGGQ